MATVLRTGGGDQPEDTRMTMEVGRIVRTIKDFFTTSESELCLCKDELLQVVENVDRHWVRCRTGGDRIGLVPSSNLTEVEGIPRLSEGQCLYVALQDFEAAGKPGQSLDLRRGTLIIGDNEGGNNDYCPEESGSFGGRPWRRGSTLDGRCGVFPRDICWTPDTAAYLVPQAKGSKSGVEKYAQVVHSMTALLDEEIDLVRGQMVRITEIIDKDWYRGECNGKCGTFPASFVRIIDSFPGDAPPDSADISCYLKATTTEPRNRNEYMNTQNAYRGLDENLRALAPPALTHAGGPQQQQKQQPWRDPLMADEYFRQNLPASYGLVSLPPPTAAAVGAPWGLCDKFEPGAPAAPPIYGQEVLRCSRGFQEMSDHLSALARGVQGRVGGAGYPVPAGDSLWPEEHRLLGRPGYGQLDENFRRIFSRQKSSDPARCYYSATTLDDDIVVDDLDTGSSVRSMDTSGGDCLFSATVGKGAGDVDDRYQNWAVAGYRGASVDVRPYGIALYNFVAQFDNELSLLEGDVVYLRRYVDQEWLEGELLQGRDGHGRGSGLGLGRRGLVPISYVNVIVDCGGHVPASSGTTMTASGAATGDGGAERPPEVRLVPNTFHKVLYTFQAQMEGDLSVGEGEVVRVVVGTRRPDLPDPDPGCWVEVENSLGESGLCPVNHLDPQPEFDGRATFDIERLLRSKKDLVVVGRNNPSSTIVEPAAGEETSSSVVSSSTVVAVDDLKFFDPLRSPDDDMLRVEAELERRAKEAHNAKPLDMVLRAPMAPGVPAGVPRVLRGSTARMAPSSSPRRETTTLASSNLDDFISTNLTCFFESNNSVKVGQQGSRRPRPPPPPPPPPAATLRSGSESLRSAKLDLSKSVLYELLGGAGGNSKQRPPPPPRPAEQPPADLLLASARPVNSSRDPEDRSGGAESSGESAFVVVEKRASQTEGQPSPAPPKPPPPQNSALLLKQVHVPGHDDSNTSANGVTVVNGSKKADGTYGPVVGKEPVYAMVNKTDVALKRALSLPAAAAAAPGRQPPRPPPLSAAAQNIGDRPLSSRAALVKASLSLEEEPSTTSIDVKDPDAAATGDDQGDLCPEAPLNGKGHSTTTATTTRPRVPTRTSSALPRFVKNLLLATNKDGGQILQEPVRMVHDGRPPTAGCGRPELPHGAVDRSNKYHHYYSSNDDEDDEAFVRKNGSYANVVAANDDVDDGDVDRRRLRREGELLRFFPPDRKSPMSPPPADNPPKIHTLPYRCPSVASSTFKSCSRSTFYYSPAAAAISSPMCSSLNHSYETLNMSDIVDNSSPEIRRNSGTVGAAAGAAERSSSTGQSVTTGQGHEDRPEVPAGGAAATLPRLPHRPAPPVPSKILMTSKERKYLQQHLDDYYLYSNSNSTNIISNTTNNNVMEGNSDEYSYVERRRMMKKNTKHPIVSKKSMRQRKIHSLRRQIQIKEKMLEEPRQLQEQLLRELDMYQEIAVAKGEEYETLNHRMDRCQDSIEKLSDDIQRLMASLADEELKAEEDTLEETRKRAEDQSRRAQLEAQMREEEQRMIQERIARNREQRENAIGELVITERDFCRDLRLTWQAFGLDTPAMLEQRNVDVGALFGNLLDIIEVSDAFLDSLGLEVKGKSSAEDQMVGKCFLQNAEGMKEAYTKYCINHDKAEQLMEKYNKIPEISGLLQRGIKTIQSQVSCFNMGSILIKPVQRILKYPLILNVLIKCTEDDHADKDDLVRAFNIMSDVAAFINESKRRKDIVDKYRSVEEEPLTRKIYKLNMHTLNKKSARISQRFFCTLGFDQLTKDSSFEEYKRRFYDLQTLLLVFSKHVQRFRDRLQESLRCQYNVARLIADWYEGQCREADRFEAAHKKVISIIWNSFESKLKARIVDPLQMQLETFNGPSRLIQKREDKNLDYSASQQKLEKNRDPSRAKSIQEEADRCRTTFEALNSQLIEELPKFLELNFSHYTMVMTEFVNLRSLLVGKILKELLAIMDLPLMESNINEIVEVFYFKHSVVCRKMGDFSFSSKGFLQGGGQVSSDSSTKVVNGTSGSGSGPGGGSMAKIKRKAISFDGPVSKGAPSAKDGGKFQHPIPQEAQTPSHRTMLRGRYASSKLYQANQAFRPEKPMEIGVNPGDLVGVIQEKDPMGDTSRWYVDNGASRGFLPRRCFDPIGSDEPLATRHPAAPAVASAVAAANPQKPIQGQLAESNQGPPMGQPSPRRAQRTRSDLDDRISLAVTDDDDHIGALQPPSYEAATMGSSAAAVSHPVGGPSCQFFEDQNNNNNHKVGPDEDEEDIYASKDVTTTALIHSYDEVAIEPIDGGSSVGEDVGTCDDGVGEAKLKRRLHFRKAPPVPDAAEPEAGAEDAEEEDWGPPEPSNDPQASHPDVGGRQGQEDLEEEPKAQPEEANLPSGGDSNGEAPVEEDRREDLVDDGAQLAMGPGADCGHNTSSSAKAEADSSDSAGHCSAKADLQGSAPSSSAVKQPKGNFGGHHHGYEEIPPPSEANSEPSQDLSPIYEEIHGGSRSSVSSGSIGSSGMGSTGSGSATGVAASVRTASTAAAAATTTTLPTNGSSRSEAIHKFFYSLYDFEATDRAVMLSLSRGQVVRILPDAVTTSGSGASTSDSARDWCYVEDRNQNRGYVPRQFLKPYDTSLPKKS